MAATVNSSAEEVAGFAAQVIKKSSKKTQAQRSSMKVRTAGPPGSGALTRAAAAAAATCRGQESRDAEAIEDLYPMPTRALT